MSYLIVNADSRHIPLRDRSVHCVVTSPPYWSLRDYGVAGQIGLEPTPDEFVAGMVRVFREVWRILRDDETCWLNLGDSYSGGKTGRTDGDIHHRTRKTTDAIYPISGYARDIPVGFKPKDLIGIPWRVALALQADGWYLRSDIIWAKPNPMPESVTDRPTKSHEYVFMLSKSERYFFDQEAVREAAADSVIARAAYAVGGTKWPDERKDGGRSQERRYSDYASGRNIRTVWTIPTEAYPGAHFACVDEETECLTIDGWKMHGDLKPGDTAAQFNVETGILCWGTIEDVARYPVENESMVHAKNRDVEMILTPNHRTIIARRHNETRQWLPLTVIEARDLKPSHAIPVSAPFAGIVEEPVSADWAELLGWYLAEGCETVCGWTVEIYQSRSANPEKVDRIRSLLIAVGAEFTEASATRDWRDEPRTLVAFQIKGFAAAYLRQWCPGKGFHPSVLRWSATLLTRLLDGLIDGDGHRREDGRFSFIQRSKASADMAQAIGVRLGYATMLSRRSEGSYSVYFTEKRLISFRGTNGEGADIKTEPYTGIVWCPKLPFGTWVARRNGRAFITGNTFPRRLVEPCVKAGTSEKGVCPECGAPWVRISNVEQVPDKGGGCVGGSQFAADPRDSGNVRGWGLERTRRVSTTLGWQPTCSHGLAPVSATVFDPFVGSGTTLVVANALGRRAIGCDLNREYLELAARRLDRPHAAVPRPMRQESHPLFDSV